MSNHNFYNKLLEAQLPETGQALFIPGTGWMQGWGTTVGNGIEGWAKGAQFIDLDAAAGARLWYNAGTSTTASWKAVTTADTAYTYALLQTFTTGVAVSAADGLTVNSVIVPQFVYGNFVPQTTEAATDRVLFLAPRAMKLVAATQIHSVAAGGASKLMLTKDTGTDAPGAGTDLLTNNTNTGFDLAATANTVQTGALVAVGATVTFAAGDRLAMDFANTIQSTAGLAISYTFQLV